MLLPNNTINNTTAKTNNAHVADCGNISGKNTRHLIIGPTPSLRNDLLQFGGEVGQLATILRRSSRGGEQSERF